MPNTQLTQNAKEAMTAQETPDVLLNLLEIKYNGNSILRVVDDRQQIVSNGKTYEPCAFKAVLPDQSSDGTNKACRLQIDNSDIAIYKTIKNAVIQSRNEEKDIECTAAVILASEPNNYLEGPLKFILRNIQADVNSITGDLLDSFMYDRNFTNMTYNPTDFPGLFF